MLANIFFIDCSLAFKRETQTPRADLSLEVMKDWNDDKYDQERNMLSFWGNQSAWFDKSLQWTVMADVRLLLECFRLELKADFDKLLLQLGAGSLFKQRPGEFIGIAPNLWRICGGWIYGGFVEELRGIYRKRSNHERRADLTLAAARKSRERIIFSRALSTSSSDGKFADFS